MDILSGSWPGEIYYFRGQGGGEFDDGRALTGVDGRPVNVGHASAACTADWNGDGRLDLIVGTFTGEVYFLSGAAQGGCRFDKPQALAAAGQAIKRQEASPAVADWDGDGRLDLLVGAEDGSVAWYRNASANQSPELQAAQTLVGPSPLGWHDDSRRQPGDWGLRVKICVVDFNGDGRLDLLLGDRCGGFEGKPSQTTAEQAEEQGARQ